MLLTNRNMALMLQHGIVNKINCWVPEHKSQYIIYEPWKNVDHGVYPVLLVSVCEWNDLDTKSEKCSIKKPIQQKHLTWRKEKCHQTTHWFQLKRVKVSFLWEVWHFGTKCEMMPGLHLNICYRQMKVGCLARTFYCSFSFSLLLEMVVGGTWGHCWERFMFEVITKPHFRFQTLKYMSFCLHIICWQRGWYVASLKLSGRFMVWWQVGTWFIVQCWRVYYEVSSSTIVTERGGQGSGVLSSPHQ